MTGDAPFAFDLAQIDRLLTTTRAVRRRLDLTRPVPRGLVLECIRLACHAPSASNAQEWRWVVVDDPEVRMAVGRIYRDVLLPSNTTMLAAKEALGDEAGARVTRSVRHLANHLGDVPCLVLACYDKAAGEERYASLLGASYVGTGEMDAHKYASIYPAVWSFQLALRSRGLGSALTTAHRSAQAQMAAVLDIPESWDQVALIPVAYTTGDDFGPAARGPVEHVVFWNGGPVASAPTDRP